MLSLSLLSLLLTTGFAASSHIRPGTVPASALHVPGNQTQLIVPSSPPIYVAAGIGIQNYSCTAGGNYTSVGAIAELYDITTLYGTPEFYNIQDDAYEIWSICPSTDPLASGLVALLQYTFKIHPLGQHFFVNFNGGLSPKFDFTQSTGDPNAFVIAKKTGDLPAPSSEDIDWLELMGVSGGLATEIFRVYTKAGKPPTTCTPGSGVITVKYSAQYWFFNSSA